jgi:hypothetical protein
VAAGEPTRRRQILRPGRVIGTARLARLEPEPEFADILLVMPRSRSTRPRTTRASSRRLTGALLAGVLAIGAAASAEANTSHAGWPVFGHRYQNKLDADATARGLAGVHDEMLGGNGSDTLYAGDLGDVLWGDYKPGSQPTTQVDTMIGGAGNDFFYASHGTNTISTGGGMNIVHAHYGQGKITCGSPSDIVYLSHKSKPHYKLVGCRHISFATTGS